MQLTQKYLKSKYDYDAKKDTFIHRENRFKGSRWNDVFPGTEVKPLVRGGIKYLYVNNALYNIDQLIRLYEEGDEIKVFPVKVETLLKKEEELKEAIKNLSTDELIQLQKTLLSSSSSRKIIRDLIKAKPVKRHKAKIDEEDKNRAINIFDENSLEVNVNTGLPYHIYYDERAETYYVKIIYQRSIHKYYGLKDIQEALLVRGLMYKSLIQAEEKGEDMEFFEVKINY
ncbi:hypothetical protein OGA32_000113 [Salmonella enterica]|nr:hypothetical protein [Salmonella enterica]